MVISSGGSRLVSSSMRDVMRLIVFRGATQDRRRLSRYMRRWLVEASLLGFNGSAASSSVGNTTPRTLLDPRSPDALTDRLRGFRFASMPQGGHPPHHSITSSASSTNESGIVSPIALAALRLTINS